MAALFGGALAASLIGPVLGMIPSASGGPQNPFSGTSAGNPLDPLLGLLGGGSSGGGGGLFGSLLGGGGSSSSSGSGSSSSTAVSPTQTTPMYIPSPSTSTSTSATGTAVSANTMASAFGAALSSPIYLVGGVVVLLLILR